MKKCCKCEVKKPISQFNRNKSRSDGVQSSCRYCELLGRQERVRAGRSSQPLSGSYWDKRGSMPHVKIALRVLGESDLLSAAASLGCYDEVVA